MRRSCAASCVKALMLLMGKPSLSCEVRVSWLVERHDGAGIGETAIRSS